MIKYRILTDGSKYRIQSKDKLFWKYIYKLDGRRVEVVHEWDSIEHARMWIKERLALNKMESKKWRVVSKVK